MNSPSLLLWLKAKLAEPRTQRRVRFGLGGLSALAGIYLGLSDTLAGYFFIALAFVFFALGLLVQGDDMPRVPWPTRDGVNSLVGVGQAVTLGAAWPSTRLDFAAWFAVLRLPLTLALALAGQWILTYRRESWAWGVALYVIAAAVFIGVAWRDRLLESARVETPLGEQALGLRLQPLGVALLAGAYTYWAAGSGQFTPDVVIAWIITVGAWFAAAWETSIGSLTIGGRIKHLWRAEPFTFRLSRQRIFLIAVLAVGAYFLYAKLPSIPPEMTSDHVEKLLDVNDILQGQRPIFFPRNTGREPLQFYAIVLVIKLFGTGLTHLSLKIVTATAGLCALPFIYLLGCELEDETLGLLAALLAGASFWLTVISRVGLRFPLSPLFVAPMLYFLVRGLKRGTRNDFLLAGLCLGAGLYGYSPFRVVPILAVVLIAWAALWPRAKGGRWSLLANALFLCLTVFFVFLPLLRYANDMPAMFWYRTLSRLTSDETEIVGSKVAIFLANQLEALRMFNWEGDRVWVNTIPGLPFLDFICGALFVLGVIYALSRLVVRGDWLAGLLLISIPILLLPSTLNLAFPEENPSIVRAGGAIPVVFILAAYPLWLLLKRLRATLPAPASTLAAAFTVLTLAGGSALINHDLYFNQYPAQYISAAQNASEIGQVIHDFAHSVGSYETAFVVPYPYWVDTRAVGIYAGNFGWDAALWPDQLDAPKNDPRPKLFILHPADLTERPDGLPASFRTLRGLYPTGTISVYHSAYPNHDFLIYFVSGTASDFNADQLLQEPSSP
jgi:hypothetical protein